MTGRLYNHFLRAFLVVSAPLNWPVPEAEITDDAHRIPANNFINKLVELVLDPNPLLFEALEPNDTHFTVHPLGETLTRIIWEHGNAGQRLVEAGKKSSPLPPDTIPFIYRDMVKRALFNILLDIQQAAIRNNLSLAPFLTNEALAKDLTFLNQETRQLFDDLAKAGSSNQVNAELSKLAIKYLSGLWVMVVCATLLLFAFSGWKNLNKDSKEFTTNAQYYTSFVVYYFIAGLALMSITAPIYMLYQYSSAIGRETAKAGGTLINWATGILANKLREKLAADRDLFLQLPRNVPAEIKELVKELEAPAPSSVVTRPHVD